jgi:hypothetical protein
LMIYNNKCNIIKFVSYKEGKNKLLIKILKIIAFFGEKG